ncbi:MAG TPA: AI-2E family transporter [Terriglobia bacterium]|nr:AI-2E family transporter [Terriglobia bacterium]
MFRVDDRAGNVVTTVALFVMGATILYIARGSFLILLLSLLFAYLLEPAVNWIQRHSRLGQKNRTWAIAQVYLLGILALGCVGYKLGPHVAAQMRNLHAAMPEILQDLSSGKPPAGLVARHGVSAEQQQRIQDFLARNRAFIARAFERGAAYIGSIVASAIWLLPIPVLAAFILRDGRQMAEAMMEAAGLGRNTLLRRILRRIDTMLAKYIRAQLALAGLSFGFYSVAMLILRFPYALALGLLGGALEFLPVVGWIISAAAILTVGFLTHAHWIWMAGLLVGWRLVQDYVNSPRITGNSLELQPLTVVFALMAGGQVGGITGVYLSVPAVAVLRIVWLECLAARRPSTALADPPPFTTTVAGGDTVTVENT